MRAYRVDKNQKSIVEELRQRGVTVFPTHMVGQGFPDIVCGYRKCNFMFEIKNPEMPPSDRQLTAAEKIFHFEWRGAVDIVETSDQAWAIIQERTRNQ